MIERQDIYQVLSTVIKLDPNVRKARVSPPVNWNYRHPSPAGQYISGVSHAGVLKKYLKNEKKNSPAWDYNKKKSAPIYPKIAFHKKLQIYVRNLHFCLEKICHFSSKKHEIQAKSNNLDKSALTMSKN